MNVDIAHKAFPKEISVLELINEIGRGGRDRREPDLNRDLEYSIKNALSDHLKGLQIKYQLAGNNATVIVRKFVDLDESAERCKFKREDGAMVSVQQHFRERNNYNIRYPKLPCIKIGNTVRSYSFPAELCSVLGGQVSEYFYILFQINKSYLNFFKIPISLGY